MADKFNLKSKAAKFTAFKKTIPIIFANDIKNFFQDSFKKGGFTDKSFKPWQPRKSEQSNNGSLARRFTRRSRESRAILVKSGELKQSIRVAGTPTFDKIKVASLGLPKHKGKTYGEVHNFGLRFRGRGKKRKFMPKRQFMGSSRALKMKIEIKLFQKVRGIFK